MQFVTTFTVVESSEGVLFSFLPLIIMTYLVLIIGGSIKKAVESIKVIYFTIFYTTITRPMNIKPELKKELTNYLLMKESDYETKEKKPKEKYLNQLADYIKQYLKIGKTENDVKKYLTTKGHPIKDIEEAIKIAKK